ncbi:hypothetical protein Vretifemale_8219 [Volvox reticuliferus]|uniref:Uncharacterized protein n=1 Tax=Volvox reticuliferus TaxID=1737510 RepID=A0A8J4CA36_9CHLO|nr:hypothetical protein Vretifemale_8219 [Volvox reticuliferus]
MYTSLLFPLPLRLPICSAYMLLGAKHKATVGQVEAQHKEEVSELIRELIAAGAEELRVTPVGGEVERLNAYARSVAHFPTAVKEVGAEDADLASEMRTLSHGPLRLC